MSEKPMLRELHSGWHRKLPWTRFVVAMLGLVGGVLRAPELGLLINRGLLSLLQTLLRQATLREGITAPRSPTKHVWAIYDDATTRARPSPSWLYGPELASMLKIGVLLTILV